MGEYQPGLNTKSWGQISALLLAAGLARVTADEPPPASPQQEKAFETKLPDALIGWLDSPAKVRAALDKSLKKRVDTCLK